MAYEGFNLDAALAVAVGDDPALTYELRRAFLESADRQIALLERATDSDSWQQALWRLKGLCGSFGIISVLALIDEVEQSRACDALQVDRLRQMVISLSAD
ncbi:MAG: Hpt domain-containing protein [Sphingobium sp.]|nr:Hpt domain-containing protein [Sphingobium sp.]